MAVVVDGRLEVDLWGGFTDRRRTAPWARDTLVNVYSTTKGFTATCVHQLVERGLLDLDAPVTRYWPEFRASAVRVHMVLDHTAGLPAIREMLPPEALFDWEVMVRAVAATEPWWEPGTKHGYHPFTFGWLAGELVRRVSGEMPGAYFRRHVADPLGLDAHIGLVASDDARCAELRPLPRDRSGPPTLFDRIMAEPTSMTARAFMNPPTMALATTTSSREWRGADLPAVNGHTTAAALARFYGVLARGGSASGVTVLPPAAIDRARAERVRGLDATLGVNTRFGLGFMLPQEAAESYGPNLGSFGHPGAGGTIGFADCEARIGFGYVTNGLGTAILVDPRARALIDAVYAAL